MNTLKTSLLKSRNVEQLKLLCHLLKWDVDELHHLGKESAYRDINTRVSIWRFGGICLVFDYIDCKVLRHTVSFNIPIYARNRESVG